MRTLVQDGSEQLHLEFLKLTPSAVQGRVVTFLIAGATYLERSNLRKEGLLLAHGLRTLSVTVRRHGGRSLKQLATVHPQ